jgi:hypothetical protein
MYFATKNEMAAEVSQLMAEKMKMDKFFSMYLDKFERKMDPEKTNTPIWKLYKEKLKEYEAMQRRIKTLQYRISQV